MSAIPLEKAAERILSYARAQSGGRLGPPWRSIARIEQLRPEGKTQWLFLAGRGAGKTRSAAERLKERIEQGKARYIALIGAKFADVRDVMVEGESGLLAVLGHDAVEKYNRSIGEIVFRGGCKARFFSGEDPEGLRGWQSTDIWGDELAAWSYPQQTYDMAMFGLRLGEPEANWTTTPKPLPIIKKLLADPTVSITRSSTYANRDNLAPAFFGSVIGRYEGTRLGRQELEGEVLEDVEGALWQASMFEVPGFRYPQALFRTDGVGVCKPPPQVTRIVVALDPSVSDPELKKNPHKDPDACGIVVVGADSASRGYVLGDLTAVLSPMHWAKTAVGLYSLTKAIGIIAEANQGGELVREVLRGVSPNVPVRLVHASVGKRARAEPVAALYEQGRVSHCGAFPELEDQMTTWNAQDPSQRSPNNIDALVWAFHGLGLCDVNEPRKTSFVSAR